MAGAVTDFRVKGAAELEAAFMQMRREVLAGLKPTIISLAGPVAQGATDNIRANVSNVGDRWSQFKIGATVRGAYVAPKNRRRGGSPRRNMGGLLLDAMSKSVDQHSDEVVAGVDAFIELSKKGAGF